MVRRGGCGDAARVSGLKRPARGEVWKSTLPMSDGGQEQKYCAIVSRDSINDRGMNVIVVRITDEDRHREVPTAIQLRSGEANLPHESWLLCHEIYTIPYEWLDVAPTGDLDLGTITEMEQRLAYALDISH